MANIFDNVKMVFTKQEELPLNAPFYLINRFLSFNNGTFGVANKLSEYIFTIEPELTRALMNIEVKKQRSPYIRYVKKAEEKKSEKYDDIIQEIRKFFHWTDKEYGVMLPLIDQLLEDKDNLYKALCFFGFEPSIFKKYGFKEEEETKKGGLSLWA